MHELGVASSSLRWLAFGCLLGCGARSGLPTPEPVAEIPEDAAAHDVGLDAATFEPCGIVGIDELPIDDSLVDLFAAGNVETRSALVAIVLPERSLLVALTGDGLRGPAGPTAHPTTGLGAALLSDEVAFIQLVDGDHIVPLRSFGAPLGPWPLEAPARAVVGSFGFSYLLGIEEPPVLWRGVRRDPDLEARPLPDHRAFALAVDPTPERRGVMVASIDDTGAWRSDETGSMRVLERPGLDRVATDGSRVVALQREVLWFEGVTRSVRLRAAPRAWAVGGSEEHMVIALQVEDELRVVVDGYFVDRFEMRVASVTGDAIVAAAGFGVIRDDRAQLAVMWGTRGAPEPIRVARIACIGFAGP